MGAGLTACSTTAREVGGGAPNRVGRTRAWLGGLCTLVVASSIVAPATAQDAPKRLLFLTHAGLYKHASLEPAEAAVTAWGAENGFGVTTLQGYLQDRDELDLSMVTAEYLAGFDGLMMMTNGNLPMSEAQKGALVDFVREGGAFIGVHNAALTFYDYPDFGEMLGAYFRAAIQQNHVFVLRVEDREHPATRMLGPSWPVVDEMYHYGTAAWTPERPEENVDVLFGNRIPMGFSRDRVRVLLSIDTEATDIASLDGVERGGDYPQSWVREYGEGRSFYTSLGHREDIWTNDPVFRAHVIGGIRWALGLEEGEATPRGDAR